MDHALGVHMLSATAAERMAYLEPLYSRALCSFPSLSDVLPEIASLFDNWVVAQHFSSLHKTAEERVRTQLHNSSPVCVDCTLEVEGSALRPGRMKTRALVYIDWTTLQGAEQKACGEDRQRAEQRQASATADITSCIVHWWYIIRMIHPGSDTMPTCQTLNATPSCYAGASS